MKARRRQHGFTLLEAIVALALFASLGLALFSLINTNLQSLNRIRAHADQADAVRNALDWMELVNPAQTPEGSTEIGDTRIQWQAQTLEPLRDGAGYPGGIGLYQVGLYNTKVTLTYGAGGTFTFNLRQTGYTQVRQPEIPL